MDPDGGGWTAWLGATIFEFGALLALIEAWNAGDENRPDSCISSEKPNTAGQLTGATGKSDPENNAGAHPKRSWYSLDRKRWRDLGFVAAVIQYAAATIFWIAGWTGLPVIFNSIQSNTGLTNGVFWSPQVIGGSGFVISGGLLMLETQKKWYKLELTSLGWHVGFWNLLGGLGFTLCPIFGYSMRHWRLYQSALSTFWGGWAFLLGSVAQWYEAVNPVEPQPVDSGKTNQDVGSRDSSPDMTPSHE